MIKSNPVKELQEYLKGLLPEHMVPYYYIPIETVPLTTNGKLDRGALPDPEFSTGDSYVAPRDELETQICAIWAEVLGLPADKVGIKDDFFKLGGNSILVIKLISIINLKYKSQIKVAEVFANPTPSKLLFIIQFKTRCQIIIQLNQTINKQKIFMIHPGAAGCEVYVPLANRLANYYSCYGVDSYNLHNTNKISSLSKLASYYLEQIDHNMKESSQKDYILLGWSLGGMIALEIASQLEARKISNIKVFLLDTVIIDDNIKKLQLLNLVIFYIDRINAY